MERWLADVRADEARLARRREEWLLAQQQESATFSGHLVDLADQHIDVAIDTAARRLTGAIAGVGLDLIVLRDHGRWSLVPLHAIDATRYVGASTPATGERRAPLDTTLGEALLELANERIRASFTLRSGDRLAGIVEAVGIDVVSVRVDSQPSTVAVLRMEAINDVVVS